MAGEWNAGGEPVKKNEGAARRRARGCRVAAGVVLALGLGGAGAVYWQGTRGPDLAADPAMLGFNRAEERQLDVLYGKQGRLIEDLADALKQPGTQAVLILLAAVVIAAGGFYFARLLEAEPEGGGPPDAT